ncbi:ABC transporter permease [Ferruginibacter paludis]|uniref:ABC transporter permease n=1 Tax=Ferruginibacter paludis TaxID=1310417 RepID=UPI0025B3AAA0|nr:ABC transporter permease [Ferruginibacter paludis]MDN3655926.1 ABC transporter permease [Ferruginibacter paludis]
MMYNYFKIAWRSFLNNKVYNSLNILGLSVGMVCAGLIFLWVEDEVNYDKFNQKKDRIYFTKVNQKYDTYTATFGSTPGVMAPAMQADITGIENTCRVTEDQTSLLFKIGDKAVYASGKYADPSLFSMFTLPFVQGNAAVAFSQLYSIVLTEKTATKFFGDDKNVLGKTVKIDNKQDYVVTGILKDLPPNSTLQFEWVAPFEVYYKQSPWAQKWGNSCVSSYVELKQGADLASVNKQLYNYLQQKQGTTTATSHAFLFSMNDWHLYDDFDNGEKSGNGRIVYVRLFSTIAWIILFIACINFMNLATARSEKRAREVGVRKVMGAGKKRLVIQFISEAFLMAFLAAIAAIVIMILLLPAFNSLVQKQLTPGLNNPMHIISIVALILVCGFVAGSYPSFYLSSFNPIFVLKGLKLKTGSAAYIRKGLVIAQFTVSIVLIIGTVVIYQQIQHVKSRNLGFNKNNLVQMNLQGDMLKNFSVIKQDMMSAGIAENVAVTDHETIYDGNNTTAVEWPGKAPNSNILISQRVVSPEFISTAGLHIASGRDFQETDIVEMGDNFTPKDANQVFNVIITQSMEKILGNGSAIGKTMQLPGQKENEYFHLNVTGVVNDYVYGNMYGKSSPVIFYCIPKFTTLMYVRTKPSGNPEQLLAKMETVMKKDNPAYPFEYKFVDDQFNGMFMSEMLISKLSQVFASLAILISCLGLFGLAAYTAERRTKEIGVRKVLGASASGLAGLLSKDFLKLVGFSCLVAFPVAWFVMDNWLKQYAYRISIHWQIFFIAGVAAMLIAAATVSFQTVKAALMNPVKSLKAE